MKTEVPFVDLQAQYKSVKKEMDEAIHRILDNTAFIGGKEVDEFEKNFEELYDVEHCVPVGNGTDSLYIIMKMLGIGQGDQSLWEKTKIGNKVSIGSNATILPVDICNNVVIGAGAVVTKDITEPGVYVGNPAMKLK